MKDTTPRSATRSQPRTVYLHESEFVRLSEIFRATGIHVELMRPFPDLPDPESDRERYRQETIERATQGGEEAES